MSTSYKGKHYFKEKKKEHKEERKANSKKSGKKSMSKKDQVTLIVLVFVIVVSLVAIGVFGGRYIYQKFNKPFSPDKPNNGNTPQGNYEEWPDIDIKSPEEMNDGRTQKKGVYTFVCCGVDLDSVHADTIMLVTLDTNTGTANVLHILRDTFIRSGEKNHKINEFYARKKSDGIRQVIYERMGIYPNYYVSLTFEAFRNIVDIIGGVEIDVPFDMKYSDPTQALYIDLKKGKQLLDGDKAEQFVRYRKGSGGNGSDDQRQERQEQFLTAFMQKCKDICGNDYSKLTSIVTEIIDHMNTNLSLKDMIDFTSVGIKMGVENIQFHTLPGEYKDVYKENGKTCFFQAYNEQTRKLLNEYLNPYEEELKSKHLKFDDPSDYGRTSKLDDSSDGSGSDESDYSGEEDDDPHSSEEDPSSFDVVDESSSEDNEPESSSSDNDE